jgi:hypothetical protein
MPRLTKRAYLRARRALVRGRLRYKRSTPLDIRVSPSETRDELIARARRVLDRVHTMRRHPAHPLSVYEIREALREASILRAAAAAAQRVDPTGRAFYVSIRDGARHGLLYGPFRTQSATLRALPDARRVASDVCADAAFAAFGTASIARESARPGVLNHLLPPIPEYA